MKSDIVVFSLVFKSEKLDIFLLIEGKKSKIIFIEKPWPAIGELYS